MVAEHWSSHVAHMAVSSLNVQLFLRNCSSTAAVMLYLSWLYSTDPDSIQFSSGCLFQTLRFLFTSNLDPILSADPCIKATPNLFIELPYSSHFLLSKVIVFSFLSNVT